MQPISTHIKVLDSKKKRRWDSTACTPLFRRSTTVFGVGGNGGAGGGSGMNGSNFLVMLCKVLDNHPVTHPLAALQPAVLITSFCFGFGVVLGDLGRDAIQYKV